MARSITQRIVLEGGDAIRATLLSIGKAGKDMFDGFQKGAALAGRDLSGVDTPIANLAKRIQTLRDASNNFVGAAGKFSDSLKTMGKNAAIVTGAITATAYGIGRLASASSDTQGELADAADAAGVSAQSLSDFRGAMQLAGLDGQKTSKVLQTFSELMRKTADNEEKADDKLRDFNKTWSDKRGTLEYAEALRKFQKESKDSETAFTKLGLKVKDGKTFKDPIEFAKEFADSLSRVDDSVERTGYAMDAFGARNSKATAVFGKGREELERLMATTRRLAPALSDEARGAVEKFGDSLDFLGLAAKSTRDQIFAAFAPTLTRGISEFTEVIAAARGRMVELATELANRLKPVMGDIIALMQGRDGDVSNKWILDIRDGFVAVGNAAKIAVGAIVGGFQLLSTVLQPVADLINYAFGTQLTGGTAAALVAITGLLGGFKVLIAGVTLLVAKFALIQSIVTPIILGVGFAFSKLVAGILLVASSAAAIPIAIAAIGFAIGFLLTKWIISVGGIQNAWKIAWEEISRIANRILEGIPILAQKAFDLLVAGWQKSIDRINELGTYLLGPETWAKVTAGAQVAWDALKAAASLMWEGLKEIFKLGLDVLTGNFDAAIKRITGWLDGLIQKAKDAWEWVKKAFGAGSGSGATAKADGGPIGRAGGGPIRGPGGPKSDKIRAWLSNGEFVVKTAAVRKYGVGLLHAINNMRLPSQGFNTGGLASAMSSAMSVPRTHYATGGLVDTGMSALRPAIINIGGDSFPVQAPQSTIDKFTRHAMQRTITSAGRKPSWKR